MKQKVLVGIWMIVLLMNMTAEACELQRDITCPEHKTCDGDATIQEAIGRTVVMAARGLAQWPVPVYGVTTDALSRDYYAWRKEQSERRRP